MLTSTLVRVRQARQNLIPCYLETDDPAWLESAERLIELFRGHVNGTRGELEEEIEEIFGDATAQQVHRGLAKLLEDRCEFAVVSAQPPDQVRAAVFRAATELRQQVGNIVFTEGGEQRPSPQHFDRDAVLAQVAQELNAAPAVVEQSLYADLRSEQQLVEFKDISAERLLQRYNVALAQAVLLKAASVEVIIRDEPPQRYRQLLRLIKFNRLLCEVEAVADNAYRLRLDGPLSLFSSTQKYGLQLALFLPAVLLCKDFELTADVRWGPKRSPKKFRLESDDRLVSHQADTGTFVPAELGMFADMFRKKIADWDIVEQVELLPLGTGFWVPDFQLIHRPTSQVVYLEVLGFWRKASAAQHLDRLRQHASAPFVLAVSEQLHVEDADLDGLPAGLYRFRQMPLADEVARLATELISAKKHPEACKSQGG